MKKLPEITLVNSNDGDWVGVYLDGRLVREDHSLDADDMLDILGINYEARWVSMNDGARLPKKLEDVNLEGEIEK